MQVPTELSVRTNVPASPDIEGSEVVSFYRDQVVFLTGVTGLLGKVVLWKLYTTCQPKKILVLVRSRKKKKRETGNGNGKDDFEDDGRDLEEVLERFDKEVLQSPILKDLAQEERFKQTIQVVRGDITEPMLGLNETDMEIVTCETTVILHGAATTKFNEHIQLAVRVNVFGALPMIQLAKKCRVLRSFLHVSTAYVSYPQRNAGIVLEAFYNRSKQDVIAVVKRIMSLGYDQAQKQTLKLIGQYPNTYTYTKNLAENLILQQVGSLPLAIVRPTIIVAAVKEPLPGWVDSLIGPSGLALSGALGFMRFMKADPNYIVDFIPVDHVCSAIIVAAWRRAFKNDYPPIPIYHVGSSNVNPTTWYSLNRFTKVYWEMYRPKRAVGPKPTALMSKNHMLYLLFYYLVHWLPASILDLKLRVQGKDPKFAKLISRLFAVIDSLSPFTCNWWLFGVDHLDALREQQLNAKDRVLFDFNARGIDWPIYYMIFDDGLRKFLLKEDSRKLTWVVEGKKEAIPVPASPRPPSPITSFSEQAEAEGKRPGTRWQRLKAAL